MVYKHFKTRTIILLYCPIPVDNINNQRVVTPRKDSVACYNTLICTLLY